MISALWEFDRTLQQRSKDNQLSPEIYIPFRSISEETHVYWLK